MNVYQELADLEEQIDSLRAQIRALQAREKALQKQANIDRLYHSGKARLARQLAEYGWPKRRLYPGQLREEAERAGISFAYARGLKQRFRNWDRHYFDDLARTTP